MTYCLIQVSLVA